jgi:hypothetical protein
MRVWVLLISMIVLYRIAVAEIHRELLAGITGIDQAHGEIGIASKSYRNGHAADWDEWLGDSEIRTSTQLLSHLRQIQI